MSRTRKPLALMIGTAVATAGLAGSALFSMNAMAHGYMQDATKTAATEGSCGANMKNQSTDAAKTATSEGKCGADMKKTDAKAAAAEGKCGEGKCGADMKKADHADASHSDHKPHTLANLDTDKDGRISRTEFATAHAGKDDRFAGIDTDSDGFISQQEFDAHHAAMKKTMGEGKCGEGKCGSKK